MSETSTEKTRALDAPARLQGALREAIGAPVVLEITRNRSRLLSAKQDRRGVWTIRAHNMFLDAPPDIVAALAGWLRNDDDARRRLREFSRAVREREAAAPPPSSPSDVADASGHPSTAAAPTSTPPSRRSGHRTRGRFHDLAVYAEKLNRLYLDGRSSAEIEWSARRPKPGARNVRLGYYDPAARRIVLSRRLDRADVPAYFVEYVLFHEMLHEVLGIGRRADGRRDIHGGLFRTMEKTFPEYGRARAYERRVWGGDAD